MQVAKHNITIVLNKPKFAGNVGAVARCAKNMGIEKITVVSGAHLSREEMKTMSTHEAADVVEDIRYCERLDDAVGDFPIIVGTTARTGSARGPLVTPREMAERLPALSRHNDIALLFGPEDRGLTNDDLRWCQLVVNIPTAGFSSLNLSHAVLILCYEIMLAESDVKHFRPKLASAKEMEGLFAQLKELLQKIGFLNPQNPDYWMMHLRRFLSRSELQAREVKIIRGICRQLEWYCGNRGKNA